MVVCSIYRIDTDKGVIGIVDAVNTGLFQFSGYIVRCSDSSGNIIAAIDRADDDIVLVGTDIDEGTAADVSLAGTAIDAATDIDELSLALSRDGQGYQEE